MIAVPFATTAFLACQAVFRSSLWPSRCAGYCGRAHDIIQTPQEQSIVTLSVSLSICSRSYVGVITKTYSAQPERLARVR